MLMAIGGTHWTLSTFRHFQGWDLGDKWLVVICLCSKVSNSSSFTSGEFLTDMGRKKSFACNFLAKSKFCIQKTLCSLVYKHRDWFTVNWDLLFLHANCLQLKMCQMLAYVVLWKNLNSKVLYKYPHFLFFPLKCQWKEPCVNLWHGIYVVQ